MNGFVLTWLTSGLVLALFGARAWVVETTRGRFTTGGSAQRGLTVATGASVVLLLVMLTFNGGLELTDLLLNGEANTTAPTDGAVVAPGVVPAPADPLAPGVPAAPANP